MRIIKLPVNSGHCHLEFCFVNGSQVEPVGYKGLMHLIEHLHFRDSSSDYLKDAKEKLEGLGVLLNAYTSDQCVSFHATFLPDHFDSVSELLKYIVYNPTFLDEDISIEKEVVLREAIDYETNPLSKATLNFKSLLFTDDWCSTIGLKEDIASANSEKVWDLYRNTFGLHNLLVMLSGPRDFLDRVDNRVFLPEMTKLRKYPRNLIYNLNTPKTTESRHDQEGLGSCYFRSGYVIPLHKFSSDKERNEVRTVLNICSEMLGSGLSSPLYKEVREKRGLCYSIASGYDLGTREDIFAIVSQLNPDKISSARVVIDNVLSTFCDDEATFNFAKNKIINSHRWSLVNPELRVSEKTLEYLSNYKIPSEDYFNTEMSYDKFCYIVKRFDLMNPSRFSTYILT